MGRPFPFIVGCGRSGTTLLRAMLERHPRLAIPPESYFPVSLAAAHASGPLDVDRLTRDLMANPRFLDWQIDEPAARAAMAGAEDFPAAIRSLYSAYAEARGKDLYGDKTPPFVLHMPTIAALFPEAVFVHLIRDGRDVASSLSRTSFGPGSLLRAAEVWVRRVRRGREAGSVLGPSRYMEVRYESLVSDPQASIVAISGFVEIEPVPEMLHPEDGATLIPSREREDHASVSKPIAVGLRDWRTHMPERDVAAVEAVAGQLLSELDYERRFPDPPVAARARAAASIARSALTRRARKGARAAKGAIER